MLWDKTTINLTEMFGWVLFINESVIFGSMSIAEKFDFIDKKVGILEGKKSGYFRAGFVFKVKNRG